MIRAILFDLDGTLVDSSADLAAAVNHARTALGFAPLPLEEVRRSIGDGMEVLIARAVPDPALVPRAIGLFKAHYAAHVLDRTTVYAGAAEALGALAHLPLGVLTNKPEGFTRDILARTGLERFFRVVIGADSGHGKKPEPGPFRAALEALGGPPPAEALMVGDGRQDLLGARAAGMAICGVGYGIGDPAELRALGPDYWIDAPEELPALVSAASAR